MTAATPDTTWPIAHRKVRKQQTETLVFLLTIGFVLCINILMTYSLKIVCTVPEVNYAVLLIVTDPCFSRIYLVVIHHKNLPKCN